MIYNIQIEKVKMDWGSRPTLAPPMYHVTLMSVEYISLV